MYAQLCRAYTQLIIIVKVSIFLSTITDQLFKVRHGVSCVPVTFCPPDNHVSTIIVSYTRKHQIWTDLDLNNVNMTYNRTTDAYSLCFHNVNESFVVLEYCSYLTNMSCANSSTLCCRTRDEFVSRAHINVPGDSSKSFPLWLIV